MEKATNGTHRQSYLFTKKQLEQMIKGRLVGVKRDGQTITVGMKRKHSAEQVERFKHKIEYYQKKLKDAGVKQ